MLPRLFANFNPDPVPNGSIEVNGSGKLNSISSKILRNIRDLGATHVWYTGVLEHATASDFLFYIIEVMWQGILERASC